MFPDSARLRSTPVRLALLFAALCMVAFAVSGAVAYRFIADALSGRLDAALHETWTVVAATYGDGDLEDITAAIRSYETVPGAGNQLFSLTDASGRRLAGNFTAPPLADGLGELVTGAVQASEPRRYRVYAGPVGTARLVVGRDLEEIDELTEVVMQSLGWAAGAVILVAAGGGVWLGLRARRRLDAIAGTFGEISRGRLEARIPLIGADDDIDALARQVNAALDRLAALVEGMRQVSADIAHDLKTPLNRLRMRLESAAGLAERGEDTSAALALAQEESQQINATFEALLRIAQLEAGARKARFAAVDLVPLLANLAEIYAEVAADAGQRLLWRCAMRAATVQGDAELLTQLLANLIENAIRHCPPGTTTELALSEERDGIVVRVADNGPGIPEDERDKVFRRLYRLDQSRSTPGSGLGLSLVRAIAELHEARVHLASNDPGLVIRIVMPRLRQAAGETA